MVYISSTIFVKIICFSDASAPAMPLDDITEFATLNQVHLVFLLHCFIIVYSPLFHSIVFPPIVFLITVCYLLMCVVGKWMRAIICCRCEFRRSDLIYQYPNTVQSRLPISGVCWWAFDTLIYGFVVVYFTRKCLHFSMQDFNTFIFSHSIVFTFPRLAVFMKGVIFVSGRRFKNRTNCKCSTSLENVIYSHSGWSILQIIDRAFGSHYGVFLSDNRVIESYTTCIVHT